MKHRGRGRIVFGKTDELFVRRIISRETDETGALFFTDGSEGAVFKYYLNAIDEANADWQSAEYEEVTPR